MTEPLATPEATPRGWVMVGVERQPLFNALEFLETE